MRTVPVSFRDCRGAPASVARWGARRTSAQTAIRCSPTSWGCRRNTSPTCGHAERSARRSELAAAIGLVQPLCILFRELRPGLATLAQLAFEVRLALLVERLAAFFAVDRGLDEQRVDQVLHVPRL